MAKRFSDENNDKKFSKTILKKASKIRKEYNIKTKIEKSLKLQRDIKDMQHPKIKKLKKKIKSLLDILKGNRQI